MGNRTVALVKRELDREKPALIRMHQLDLFRDTLGEDVDPTGLLQSAMRIIGDEGSGVIVLINHAQPDTLSWTSSGGATVARSAELVSFASAEGPGRGTGSALVPASALARTYVDYRADEFERARIACTHPRFFGAYHCSPALGIGR